MLATHSARLGSSVAVAGALVGLVLGLSTAPAALASTLSDVGVERSGETTVVSLSGMAQAGFTSSQGEGPRRVVVDLIGIDPDAALPSTMPVFDGVVEEVSVAGFSTPSGGNATRIEVLVASDVVFEVKPAGNSLQIRVTPRSAGDTADATSPEMETVAAADAVEAVESDAPEAQPAAPAPRWSGHLLAMGAEHDERGTVVRLKTDTAPDGIKSFTLENPARLVIDLPDVGNRVRQNSLQVGSAQVQRVRVGQHDDGVRVVFDVTNADILAERQLMPLDDGLAVAMGTLDPETVMAMADRALQPKAQPETAPMAIAQADTQAVSQDDSMPAAMAEPEVAPAKASKAPAEPAAAPSPAMAQVESVDFVAGAEMDQVVVKSDRPIEYQVYRPDETTWVLMVPGATLADAAAGRTAPEAGGPVSQVSAFQQPDLARPEVRVVIQRAAGLEPSVRHEGNSLVTEWVRASQVAATPPVLAETGATMAPAMTVSQAPAMSTAPPASMATAPMQQVPAAIEPEQSIDVLEEGGLLDGKEYLGRRISLDFKDVDIRDVLRLIADVSDLNVIAGDEVAGNVTIRLVDVPWDQALDVILLTKGLGFVRVGNVLRIAPGDLLAQEEEGRLQERRAKEKLEDLIVKLQPVNYANVKEVADLVRRLLTARGSVDTDQRTNTVIIKDIPSVIDEATALIKAIDTQTPQVMIEARIVEASLDFSRELGTEWGLGSQPDEDEDDFTIGGIKPITVQDTGFPFEDANNVVISNPITSTPTGLMNLGAFILDDRFNVNLRLAAAEVNGEGKVVSSPRIVTLDNREALIEQGVAIPFQTFENGDAQLEFIDAVLSLKVTPHITADRSIIMSIEVSRNAPDSSVDTPTGSPAIAKNQAKTETLIKDGQTLVIGGIYVIDKAETQSRVPYLWEVPVIGNLFKNKGTRDQRKELLIFVTPQIVVGQEQAS